LSEEDRNQLAQMARRNWIILALLLAASTLAHNLDFTFGVLWGGLIAVAGYHWLYSALLKVLSRAETDTVQSFQMGYLFRLFALAAVLSLLIAVLKVNIVGLVIGLSVVVINIFWTTVKRIF